MSTNQTPSVHTQAGSVVALWRYPVKSMMGEELNSSEITERGLLGDRMFAVVDRATGKIGGGQESEKMGQLLRFSRHLLGACHKRRADISGSDHAS